MNEYVRVELNPGSAEEFINSPSQRLRIEELAANHARIIETNENSLARAIGRPATMEVRERIANL